MWKRFYQFNESYLKNRTQVVSVNETKLNTTEIASGVPKGFIQRPFLFFIFINDLI